MPPVPYSFPFCILTSPYLCSPQVEEFNIFNTSVGDSEANPARVGVPSFASTTKPGSGFLSGTHAQEELLTRASTLYASLVTPTATQFYELHKGN